jgi:hypothetical protein
MLVAACVCVAAHAAPPSAATEPTATAPPPDDSALYQESEWFPREGFFPESDPLPDLTALEATGTLVKRDHVEGVEAFSLLGETTVEYRTSLGLGFGVSTESAWSISQNVRLAPNLNIGLYLLQSLGPQTPARSLMESQDQPGQQIQFRFTWEF